MLTDAHCRNATCPPDRKQARFTDAGGLYLQVSPSCSKRWFYKYRIDGKEKQLALGSYPAVGLTAARKARDAAKLQRAEGSDPIAARKLEKLKGGLDRGHTFQAVALEWHAKQAEGWSVGHAERTLRQLERDLFPWLGERPMASIEPMELLSVLQKVEERGALETADRALMLARQVWRYWLPTANNTQRDITEGLKSRLTPYRGKNFAAIVEPQRFGELLRAMHAYKGGPIVRSALYGLGFGTEQSWHGFRASARTMLVDQLDLDPLAIEANLAHAVKDANGRSYNRTKYLTKRFDLVQQWADYLDKLRRGADVIELHKRAS